MRSIGFDLSTVSTGWAVIEDNLVLKDYGIIDFTKKQPFREKLLLFGSLISQVIERQKPLDYLVFEDTFVLHNIATTKILNKFSGVAIYSALKVLGQDPTKLSLLAPAAIRSAIFPKMKTNKEMVYSHICEKYSLVPDKKVTRDDIPDAIAAAMYPHLKPENLKWIL